MKIIMKKHVIIGVSLLLVFLLPVGLSLSNQSSTYDSLVVCKIENMTSHQFEQASQLLLKRKEITLEYSCQWSGVLVVKLNGSPLHVKGDIQGYLKNTLDKAKLGKQLQFLHIHTEQAVASNRC